MAKSRFDADRLRALVDLLAPARLTRVVEVGANPINDNPYGALRDAGLCHVWGFEPGEEAFARLTPSARETYLPVAVGDGTEQTFHLTKSISLASLLEPDPATAAFWARLGKPGTVVERIPVKTARIDDLDEIPEFDLLKIDVQGGEMMVYDGAPRRLDTALMVISEVGFMPIYKDQPLLDAQMARLRGHGFDLHKFLHLKALSLRGGMASTLHKRRHQNQLVDGDAVFLRSLRRPEALSDEQLKHMAILAEAVAESFDVVARCLDHLVERGAVAAAAAEAHVARLPDQA